MVAGWKCTLSEVYDTVASIGNRRNTSGTREEHKQEVVSDKLRLVPDSIAMTKAMQRATHSGLASELMRFHASV